MLLESTLSLILVINIYITYLGFRRVKIIEEWTSWDGAGEGTGYHWPSTESYYITHGKKVIKGNVLPIIQYNGLHDFYLDFCCSLKKDLKLL